MAGARNEDKAGKGAWVSHGGKGDFSGAGEQGHVEVTRRSRVLKPGRGQQGALIVSPVFTEKELGCTLPAAGACCLAQGCGGLCSSSCHIHSASSSWSSLVLRPKKKLTNYHGTGGFSLLFKRTVLYCFIKCEPYIGYNIHLAKCPVVQGHLNRYPQNNQCPSQDTERSSPSELPRVPSRPCPCPLLPCPARVTALLTCDT